MFISGGHSKPRYRRYIKFADCYSINNNKRVTNNLCAVKFNMIIIFALYDLYVCI